MKVINRKSEREKERIESEKNSPAAIASRENDKRKQEETERNERIVRVVLDWRVSGQLDPWYYVKKKYKLNMNFL